MQAICRVCFPMLCGMDRLPCGNTDMDGSCSLGKKIAGWPQEFYNGGKGKMIDLTHICKDYRSNGCRIQALRDVNLTVDDGEFVAVVGRSGSGKTTLMNILGCLDEPTQGCYRLDGRLVAQMSGSQRAWVRNRQIGFVFQSFNLAPALSALENVELPLAFRGEVPALRRKLALQALEQVGLRQRASHRPAELSGGQQQRVAIARALAARPPLILADEPTGNLDQAAGEQVMELLEELHRSGHTIVLITHDNAVAARAGRRVRMEDGVLREE